MANKKLRLDLDHLRIDSFSTQAAPVRGRGTVAGHLLDRTSTFDLGKYTFLCTASCPEGTLACYPETDQETA